MILSITKLELISYSKLFPFFSFNRKIIAQLKQSKCKKYKITGNWNLKSWYTMTQWENEADLNEFYRNGAHLEAMKAAKNLASNLESRRLEDANWITWREAKKFFKS
jgi:hypothetical protein